MREIVDLKKETLAQRRFDVRKMAELLEQAYLDGRREPSDRAKKSFAPSGVGYGSGTCPRQWWYAFTGGIMREEDTDAVAVANMAYGTEAHERIQGLFERSGILIEKEKKVVTDDQPGMPPIFGFADLIVKWQGEEAVGEIKTTTQESYVSKISKGQPAGYHLLQVLIYMKVLGLNKGFLLYENKNMQSMLILPVTWNETNKKLADDTFNWMNLVYDNWKDGSLPKRPFKSERSVACKSCAFTTHCWQDSEGVVDLPVLEVPK
jgi:CRISPR/Cas system-associated exonuclease Cas4 (RecB family)